MGEISAGDSFTKCIDKLNENPTNGFFSVDGTPIGPGYGLLKIKGGYLCVTCMTCVTAKITEDELKIIPTPEELNKIKTNFEDYRQKLIDFLGYPQSMFVDWIIYGCGYKLDTSERSIIHAICFKWGNKLIKDLETDSENLPLK